MHSGRYSQTLALICGIDFQTLKPTQRIISCCQLDDPLLQKPAELLSEPWNDQMPNFPALPT